MRGGNRAVVHTHEAKVIVSTLHDDHVKVSPKWNDLQDHPPEEPFALTYDELTEFIDGLIDLRGEWRKRRKSADEL